MMFTGEDALYWHSGMLSGKRNHLDLNIKNTSHDDVFDASKKFVVIPEIKIFYFRQGVYTFFKNDEIKALDDEYIYQITNWKYDQNKMNIISRVRLSRDHASSRFYLNEEGKKSPIGKKSLIIDNTKYTDDEGSSLAIRFNDDLNVRNIIRGNLVFLRRKRRKLGIFPGNQNRIYIPEYINNLLSNGYKNILDADIESYLSDS